MANRQLDREVWGEILAANIYLRTAHIELIFQVWLKLVEPSKGLSVDEDKV